MSGAVDYGSAAKRATARRRTLVGSDKMQWIVPILAIFLTIGLAGLTQLEGVIAGALGPFRFLFP